MVRIKAVFLIWIGFVQFSCEKKVPQVVSSNINVMAELWVDETKTYLPDTGEWTNRVEVADINGDNMLDLLFANGGDYSEPGALEFSRIFINKGPEKRFEEITTQVFMESKYYARVIKVRDINKDSIPDMIVGTTFQTQSQLYIGLGNGYFQNVTSTQFPEIKSSIGDLEIGDIDDDGDLDIVLADWGSGSNMDNSGGKTMLWLNDGKGNFQDVTKNQMPNILIQFSWDLEFIDFDNDFDLDIAISCKRCGTSRLFENDGKGFYKNIRAIPAYTNNYEFEVMDVNNDGFLDLVTVNDGAIVQEKAYSRREHIFLNDNGKKFIDATKENWPDSENVGEDDNNITFLDYDSDGDPDFLISSLTGEDRLLVNNGKGQFKLVQPVLKGDPTPLTLSMVLGDINNDKKLDIIMGQGEGKEGIEERIFIAKNINPDTAPPVISHHQISKNDDFGTVTIKARIHDNKSPNMPQDWSTVDLILNEESTPIPMTWYGENLWKVVFPYTINAGNAKICATDYCGNKSCIRVNI
ncbi:MAG: VCBS repeat-containing protein [Maribacter sp.]|nr:VCBS repeat-containing protein [Maribacter sp.]